MSDAGADAPQPVSYGRRFTDLAAAHPDTVTLVFAAADGGEREITSGELEERARATAHLLEQRGVGQGSTVVVGLRNSPEHVFTALGAWKLGACVVPLRWDLPAWERDRVLEVARPTVIVAQWDDVGPDVISRDDIADAPRFDGEMPDRVANPARAVASGGATGRPKLIVTPTPGEGVPGQAAGVMQGRYPGSAAGQVQLIPAPLYHTNGFAICHSALFEDQKVVLLEAFDAARIVDLVERHRVALMTMAPTMLLRLARLPDIDQRDFSSIVGLMQGAAKCPEWLVRKWIGLVGPEHFFIAYGSTENVGITLIRGDEWLEHPGSVGQGVFTDIRVLGPDGSDLPPGEVGDVFMRSQTATGPTYEYRGAPAARTSDDGFTTVGDLGWLDDDGYLYIADRRVDMIVSGGANVFPAEVEAALSEHPAVGDVAVVGLPDEEWGHRVHAVVQPVDPAAPPSLDDLAEHCRARLAAYKVPRSFEVVDALPRTEAGKLNRASLVAERTEPRPLR